MPKSIFLSYARKDDEPFARRIYEDLTRQGIGVWFDREDMLNRGVAFTHEIATAIETACRLLLVVGPAALTSDYVKAEWRHALAMCKPVHPLLRLSDYASIPIELNKFDARDFRDEDHYAAELQSLVRQFQEAPAKTGHLVGVPELPDYFRPRPDDLNALKRIALADLHRPVALVGTKSKFGPHGAGGRGKTTLAAALARDCEIRCAFPDGIFWIEFGPDPALLNLQAAVARALGDSDAAFTETSVGRARLSTLLADRACLVVLDNVWDAQHSRSFACDTLGPGSRVLVTTRDAGVLAALGAETWSLDVLAHGDAVALLASSAKWVGGALPPDAIEVARECRGEPYSLVTIGGAARGIPNPWSDLLRHLRNPDHSAIRDRMQGNPRWEMLRPIEISVQALPNEKRSRYLDLAVFPRGAAIPESAVLTLWKSRGLDDFCARGEIRDLVDRSLLLRDAAGRVTLHDHNFDYLQAMVDDRRSLHRLLVDSYRARCPSGWHTCPEDGYLQDNIAYHLHQADLDSELGVLLKDSRWMQARLDFSGITALLEDYRIGPDEAELDLVSGALRLSAHILASNPCQLASQLVGRLSRRDDHRLQAICNRLTANAPRPYLVPRTSSLICPGGPLMRTLLGHDGSVNCVALTGDATRAISGSGDNSLNTWDLTTGKKIRTLLGHASPIQAVALTPDGKRAISGSNDWTLKVWDVESGRELRTLFAHTGRITSIAITADGRHGVSGADDMTLVLWDLDTGADLRTMQGHSAAINAVAITPDGMHAVSGSDDGTLKVWDLKTGTAIRTLSGHTRSVSAVAVARSGATAISGSWDNTLMEWNLETGKHLRTLAGHRAWISSVAVVGGRVLSGSGDNTLKVWSLASGRELQSLSGHARWVNTVALSTDGRRALSGSWDNTIKLWNLDANIFREADSAHTGAVNSVAVAQCARRAISGSEDHTLKVWDVDTGKVLRTLSGHVGPINSVAIDPDGKLAVSASDDQTIRVWDLAAGKLLRVLQRHVGAVNAVALIGGAKHILSASDDQTMILWDVSTGADLHTYKQPYVAVTSIAITDNGKRAIVGLSDSSLQHWDLETWDEICTLGGYSTSLDGVNLTLEADNSSPDLDSASLPSSGMKPATDMIKLGVATRTIMSPNVPTQEKEDVLSTGAVAHNTLTLDAGMELRTLLEYSGLAQAVAVSADGKVAVSASWGFAIQVWDISTGTELRVVSFHSGSVRALAIAGNRAISGSDDNSIKVWDVKTGHVFAEFTVDAGILSCSATQDGESIVIGDELGQVHFLSYLE